MNNRFPSESIRAFLKGRYTAYSLWHGVHRRCHSFFELFCKVIQRDWACVHYTPAAYLDEETL